MTLQLSLGATPVALAPGVATRLAVELRNPTSGPVAVRVSLAGGRAAGWAHVEPADVTVEAGGTAAVEVVLRAPAEQPPSPALMPFTVHAVEAATGEPAGFTTGLLTVAVPVPVVGDLVAGDGHGHTFDLRLSNDSDAPAQVRVAAELDPPAGAVTVQPAAVHLEPGAAVTAVVQARPARPLLGAPKPYFVIATVTDAHDPERPPLLTLTGTGTRTPRVANWAAAAAAIVLALAATVAVAVSGVRLPLPGSGRAATPAPPAAPASPPSPAAVATVGRPYALIEVFPDGGRAAAEAARVRLTEAGMPVRLVDSRTSEVLADGRTGYWVLLQDGFPTAGAAEAFCVQWRALAPKCTVTA